MIKTGRTFSTASSNRGVKEPLHATASLIIIKNRQIRQVRMKIVKNTKDIFPINF
ncbi:hypothetical protein NC652_041323 [Populus alba x Populus x berolinensis]|nr:hypothetical protein NC652_041323 [Populus alba x Populus x berolinensis]